MHYLRGKKSAVFLSYDLLHLPCNFLISPASRNGLLQLLATIELAIEMEEKSKSDAIKESKFLILSIACVSVKSLTQRKWIKLLVRRTTLLLPVSGKVIPCRPSQHLHRQCPHVLLAGLLNRNKIQSFSQQSQSRDVNASSDLLLEYLSCSMTALPAVSLSSLCSLPLRRDCNIRHPASISELLNSLAI